jgi:ATP-dependent DNA helicase RecQ
MEQLTKWENAVMYNLVENYRSKSNLIEFSNYFARRISHRLKQIPIIPIQPDNGLIKIIRYQNNQLIIPFVSDIHKTELVGTTTVLTKTNEEALQIAGLLVNMGMPAKVVQTNDGFGLDNLLEIRFFLSRLELADDISIISDELWENGKHALVKRFQNSTKLDVCKNMIRDFEAISPGKKYKSDLMMFIRESKLEDFMRENGQTILVSTIHKAKGKEFDNVFLLLEGVNLDTDDVRRQIYVALTRAKKQMVVHLNGTYLDDIHVADLLRFEDRKIYTAPKVLSVYLKYTEVWLGYFADKQDVIAQLTSGDELIVNGYECLNAKGQSVLKPSRGFIQRVEKELRHYVLTGAKVNVILYWKGEGMEKEVLIVLPEFYFERKSE